MGARILQLCHDYEGPFRSLCQQYSSAFDDVHVTTLFLCGEPDADVAEQVGGDDVVFFDLPRRAMKGLKISTLLRLHRFLKTRHFDLVIAQRYRPVYFAGILSLFHPIQAVLGVVHEHGVYRARARKRVIWYGSNISLIGVSDSVSADLERTFPGLTDEGRLFTLPNSIDSSSADELLDRHEARQRLGLPAEGFVFGTVGRLIDKKEHHVLIEGFARYADQGGEGVLAIVGGGPLESELKALARELGVENRVCFTGHVPHAFRLMKAFDTFVLSSGELEAFGVVLLEAMLARIPVISSSAPGPLEVVGDSAVTFPTGDTETLAGRLADLFAQTAEERAAMGARGFERYTSRFSPERFRERLRSLPPVASVLEPV